MNPKKKRLVNHELRKLQLTLHEMHDNGLILYGDMQKMTSVIQEQKYPLEELRDA